MAKIKIRNLINDGWIEFGQFDEARMLTAGSYLSGGGDLSADRRFDVDASLLVPSARTLTGGTGIAAIGDLSADRYVNIDTAATLAWTGTHSFPKVGIGTTGPETALHIATNVGSGVKLERGTLDARWWGASNGPAYFGTISNDVLKFRTNNVDRMTIASGGGYGAVDVINLLTAGNLKVDGAVGDESVFNDDGVDCDFRIESSGNSGMFFVDGGNNRIGIGDTSPNHKFDVEGNIGLVAGGYLNWGDTDGTSGYGFKDNAGTVQYKNSGGAWADLGGVPTSRTLTAGSYLSGGGDLSANRRFDVEIGNIDHGGLAGLDDGDHGAVYYTETEINNWRNSTTQTEMGYVHGVTSDIQDQLDAAGTGGKQSVTKVVSTVDGEGDYYCNGTNDHVEIQQAIDAVEAAGGGTVLLREGIYNTAAMLVINSDGVTLAGVGAKAYEFADTEYGTIIKASGCDGIGASKACELRDFVLTTDTTTKVGIKLDGKYQYVHNVVLTGDVRANDYWSKCIYCEDVLYANFNFITMYGGTPNTHTRGSGFYLESSYNSSITNCQMLALDYCVFMASTSPRCEGITCTNNTFMAVDYAVYIQDTTYFNITANLIDAIWVKAIYVAKSAGASEGSICSNWIGAKASGAGASYVAVDLVGAHRVQITGNEFYGDNGAGYGVKADSNSHLHTITGNNFLGLDYGVHTDGDDATISSNTFATMDTNAVYLGSNSADNIVIGNFMEGNTVSDNGTNNKVIQMIHGGDVVQFSGEVRFGDDSQFRAWKSGSDTMYGFGSGFYLQYDQSESRINVYISGGVVAYADGTGWHNV